MGRYGRSDGDGSPQQGGDVAVDKPGPAIGQGIAEGEIEQPDRDILSASQGVEGDGELAPVNDQEENQGGQEIA